MRQSYEPATRYSPTRKRRLPPFSCLPLLVALAASACTGIVVEPADETSVSGSTRFWGYALQPGDTIQLEARNSSNQWESLATTTSTTIPTYAGTLSGYHYELVYNPRSAPVRFRRPAPWPGMSTIEFRIKSPSLSPAETRRFQNAPPNPVPPGFESNLEQAWAAAKGNGVLRIYFNN